MAGFIGAPAMNFLIGEIADGSLISPLGTIPLSQLGDASGVTHTGRVVVGVRPESFEDASLVGERPGLVAVTATVDVLESTGSDVYAHLSLNGHGWAGPTGRGAAAARARSGHRERGSRGRAGRPARSWWPASGSPTRSPRARRGGCGSTPAASTSSIPPPAGASPADADPEPRPRAGDPRRARRSDRVGGVDPVLVALQPDDRARWPWWPGSCSSAWSSPLRSPPRPACRRTCTASALVVAGPGRRRQRGRARRQLLRPAHRPGVAGGADRVHRGRDRRRHLRARRSDAWRCRWRSPCWSSPSGVGLASVPAPDAAVEDVARHPTAVLLAVASRRSRSGPACTPPAAPAPRCRRRGWCCRRG